MVDGGRRAVAQGRIDTLLAAWQVACQAIMTNSRAQNFLVGGAVREEIWISQGVDLPSAGFLHEDMAGYPCIDEARPDGPTKAIEEFLEMDSTFLTLVVATLRAAWRDATGCSRPPSLGGLGSSSGVLRRLNDLRQRGYSEPVARRLIGEGLAAIRGRWRRTLERHRAYEARDRRPRAVPSKPAYTIFQTAKPGTWRVRFKSGERRGKTVTLSAWQEVLCLALADGARPGAPAPMAVDYKTLFELFFKNRTYERSIELSCSNKINQLIRQRVSRFNLKWKAETGDEGPVLLSRGKPGGGLDGPSEGRRDHRR
jgi:hypothetical protein